MNELPQISIKIKRDMPLVYPQEFEDFNKCVRVFSQRVIASGVLRKLKDRRYCQRRSDFKKLKARRANTRRARQAKG
jgi:ribosomal protein S21